MFFRQASTVAAPVPQSHIPNRPKRKDFASLQPHEEGRSTPPPQYAKTQPVPFKLTLQEDKNNPGQFQLVVNLEAESDPNGAQPSRPAASTDRKLYTNLQAFPSLGYNVSPLYQTQKASPPTSPQQEKGWSDLDAIHPDFLQKVVPDWEVTFQRKDSTASTQSRKLADIKARIKKSGKGFVVRLLKGSSPDTSEVAEIRLGQGNVAGAAPIAELDSCPQAELDGTEQMTATWAPSSGTVERADVFEIGTSGEPGLQRHTTPAPSARVPSSVPEWLRQTTTEGSSRYSISDDWLSDAETLTHDVPSIRERLEDDRTDPRTMSTISSVLPTRSTSISSIVKTPTRGLSVVGPVKRINKGARTVSSKGKSARSDLNRSDARRSFKRRSPHTSSTGFSAGNVSTEYDAVSGFLRPRPARMLRSQTEQVDSDTSEENANATWSHNLRNNHPGETKVRRRPSAEDMLHPTKPKSRLRLQTNVPRPKSANTSPLTQRKRSPRLHKPRSSSSSINFAEDAQNASSPSWSEVDGPEELREALERAFGTVDGDATHQPEKSNTRSIPKIEEPIDQNDVGAILLPPGLELRSPPTHTSSPTLTFWGLALSALSKTLFDGLHALRLRYGAEPPIPPNHVRVRWTCVSTLYSNCCVFY